MLFLSRTVRRGERSLTCVVSLQDCEERGEEFDRVKLMEIGAEQAERWDRMKKKKNPDPGFSGQLPLPFHGGGGDRISPQHLGKGVFCISQIEVFVSPEGCSW